jgi:5-methylcytosine-specific restriction protein A
MEDRLPITFERLVLGGTYERPTLAKLWGYKDWHALGRGVVTPARDNKIVLFVTREKQASLRQYRDEFHERDLHWEGPDDHRGEDRILGAAASGEEIHIFFRERHHSPFTYYGEASVKEARPSTERGKPSKFVFRTARWEATSQSSLGTELEAGGEVDREFLPEEEGRERLRVHVTYERSRKNRARALEIHGARCSTCRFDFNEFYGRDHARDYIEIHHVTSITAGPREVDPEKDLVPLCSNCHKMVHRQAGQIMPVGELRRVIARARRSMENTEGAGGPGEGPST